ncbi:hypothetical protein GQ43DRAFT_132873 [Delitschia confertaspora ATCC 74209]|uniref:Uncharacterized protein n=1 Tax=Delitschia confertaspora ATCC 74209 TaxID=1513339 RepID=A0A9P4JKY6_9PLEO|nr:hypothetical protein GQ43DRAFT_132873 [Delitschia confertaspora ATCC 74209]
MSWNNEKMTPARLHQILSRPGVQLPLAIRGSKNVSGTAVATETNVNNATVRQVHQHSQYDGPCGDHDLSDAQQSRNSNPGSSTAVTRVMQENREFQAQLAKANQTIEEQARELSTKAQEAFIFRRKQEQSSKDITAKLNDNAKKFEDLQHKNKQLKEELSDARASIELLHEKVATLHAAQEAGEGQKDRSVALKDAQKIIDGLKKEIAGHQKTIDGQKKENADRKKEITLLRAELGRLTSKHASIPDLKANLAKLEKDNEQLETDVLQGFELVDLVKEKKKAADAAVQQFKAEAEKYKAEAQQYRVEAEQRLAEVDKYKKKADHFKAKADHFKANSESRKEEVRQHKTGLQQYEADMVEKQKSELAQLKHEIEKYKVDAEYYKADAEQCQADSDEYKIRWEQGQTEAEQQKKELEKQLQHVTAAFKLHKAASEQYKTQYEQYKLTYQEAQAEIYDVRNANHSLRHNNAIIITLLEHQANQRTYELQFIKSFIKHALDPSTLDLKRWLLDGPGTLDSVLSYLHRISHEVGALATRIIRHSRGTAVQILIESEAKGTITFLDHRRLTPEVFRAFTPMDDTAGGVMEVFRDSWHEVWPREGLIEYDVARYPLPEGLDILKIVQEVIAFVGQGGIREGEGRGGEGAGMREEGGRSASVQVISSGEEDGDE